jgi:hypothetical protein
LPPSTDTTWINFITQLSQYTSTYFPSQVVYIEVWNEPNVPVECNSPNDNGGNCTAKSLAQMTMDASTTAKAIYTQAGIPNNVLIISPPPTSAQPVAPATDCTGSPATIVSYLATLLGETPSVAQYADIIGFHGYTVIPELLAAGSGKPDPAAGASCGKDLITSVRTAIGSLTTKPLYDTEASWSTDCRTTGCTYTPNTWIRDSSNSNPLIYQVQAEEAAFTGASYLIQASNTACPSGTCNMMAGFSWYGWDFDNQAPPATGSTGEFWNQWTVDQLTNTYFTPAGVAYTTLYSWLQGATPVSPCSYVPNPNYTTAIGVWTCQFAGPNGSSSVAAWDNSQTCVGITTTCTYPTAFTFPAGEYTEWRDLYGGGPYPLGTNATSVQIGLVPILLDNGTVP